MDHGRRSYDSRHRDDPLVTFLRDKENQLSAHDFPSLPPPPPPFPIVCGSSFSTSLSMSFSLHVSACTCLRVANRISTSWYVIGRSSPSLGKKSLSSFFLSRVRSTQNEAWKCSTRTWMYVRFLTCCTAKVKLRMMSEENKTSFSFDDSRGGASCGHMAQIRGKDNPPDR